MSYLNKNISRALFVLGLSAIVLISCKKKPEEPIVIEETILSIGECGEFFNSGDYSSICYSDDVLPNDSLLLEITSGGVKGCEYILFDDALLEDGLAVVLTQTDSKITAQGTLSATKNNLIDEGVVISNTSGIGEDAFFAYDMLTEKVLYIRQNNIIIQLGADEDGNCYFSDNEIKYCAQLIIDNLQ